MAITTTQSLSGKESRIPTCARCKQRVEGVLYTRSPMGEDVCSPCSGRENEGLIKVIKDKD